MEVYLSKRSSFCQLLIFTQTFFRVIPLVGSLCPERFVIIPKLKEPFKHIEPALFITTVNILRFIT